jgi:hypothetical protein
VIEGSVDDAIHVCRSAAQAFEVFKSPAMHLGSGCNESLRARIAASHAEHLMASADQLRDYPRTNKACCSCNKYTHVITPVPGFSIGHKYVRY